MEPSEQRPNQPPDQAGAASDERDETDEPEAELDLLTIGLAVFFVSLIVIVAALLVLPAIV